MRILFLLVPGFFVGWFVVDWMRQPFSQDDQLLKRWFEQSPVTVIAACTSVGSIVVWGVLTLLGFW